MIILNEENWTILRKQADETLPKGYGDTICGEFGLTRGRISQIRRKLKDNEEPPRLTELEIKVLFRIKELCENRKIENKLVNMLFAL